jgi:hypothetical protein
VRADIYWPERPDPDRREWAQLTLGQREKIRDCAQGDIGPSRENLHPTKRRQRVSPDCGNDLRAPEFYRSDQFHMFDPMAVRLSGPFL